ncbi:MAG: hypothetical protein RMJ35_05405, partial [Phycisphaerales bacterium]|nr:hypothetical protein [Phycisphaerales bacterium]
MAKRGTRSEKLPDARTKQTPSNGGKSASVAPVQEPPVPEAAREVSDQPTQAGSAAVPTPAVEDSAAAFPVGELVSPAEPRGPASAAIPEGRPVAPVPIGPVEQSETTGEPIPSDQTSLAVEADTVPASMGREISEADLSVPTPSEPVHAPVPPLLFEIAWEVCWQLGGIYTVL